MRPESSLYGTKMILISGLLYGYYALFLRNAPFHRYNRAYLLGITITSLIPLPLCAYSPFPAYPGTVLLPRSSYCTP